ncbi:MAG TPA: hypothetical protein PKZ75_09090 [Bacteroidia bacterium]|nr:hypothetical protein [Bacteroidia bacterium]
MTTTATKKSMHHAIDVIDDKDFLKAIYVLLNDKSKEYDFELTDGDKKELDVLKKQNKAGKLKSVSLAQIRKEAYGRVKK